MQYFRPGAYTERVDRAGRNRAIVRTDIAAFVGIAQQGPLHTPVPVQSFRQFQVHFGEFTGAGYLAYAVRAFFENGGQRCWVVRVASTATGVGAKASAVTLFSGTAPFWQVAAANPGVWGNQLSIHLISEQPAQTAMLTAKSTPLYASVANTAGFQRGDLVTISQEVGGAVNDQTRVVSFVDPVLRRIYWQHPIPGEGLPFDNPLAQIDGNFPAVITRQSYRISVLRKGRLVASYGDISLVPGQTDYGPDRLASAIYPTNLTDDTELPLPPPPIVIRELRSQLTAIPQPLTIPSAGLPLAGGRDGLAALTANDFTGSDFSVSDSDALRSQRRKGITALNLVDEIAIAAVPDIVIQPAPDPVYRPEPLPEANPCVPCPPPPETRREVLIPARTQELPPIFSETQIYQVQAALVQHCERRGDRFAVLDPPYATAQDDERGIAAINAWRSRFESTYAALYYPWIKVVDPRGLDTVRSVPPCGHALGQYAFYDNTVGVHRAPANKALVWAQDISNHTSFGEQELLNPLGINVLRSETSRGLRIMGARTVSSDPDWRYVNVRRLLIMLRETLDIISQWVVFEPNNATTRNKFQVAITSYLTALWTQGALVGATEAEAFFVKCDEENNPGEARNNGLLLAEIGVAPSIPFEFVIVRVGMQDNELEITESRSLARAA